MANEEHLRILQQGVAAWNQWREYYPDVKPDLSRTDLNGLDLRTADLQDTNLSLGDLSGANRIGRA